LISLKIENTATTNFAIKWPFSVYLGWISVATIANVTALLVTNGWGGFGIAPQVWTVSVIVVAIGLGLYATLGKKDIGYALVVDWALLGIFLKRYSLEGLEYTGIIFATLLGIGLISVAIIYSLLKSKRNYGGI
jgi:hypothetical protein